MTQPKSRLINQVINCCQEGNPQALDNIFDNLNEQVLAGSLGKLQDHTAYYFFKKYMRGKLSSVTHIRQTTAPQKKKNHNTEKKKRTEPEEARYRGIRLHRWIENYLNGKSLEPCPEDLEPWASSIEYVLNKIQRVLYLEDSVFHLEMGYWGKVDCIVQVNGVNCLVDWKTADEPYDEEDIHEYKIQCAAYLEAANKTYGLALRHVWIVVALPNQEAQEFRLELEELNQYFQEWKHRVKKFWAVMPTLGTVITNPDSSTFTVQKLLSLEPILQYKATNFQPSLRQVNPSLDTHTFSEKPKSVLELLVAEEAGLEEGLDIQHKDQESELGKVRFTRSQMQTRRKQYTEDSIRLYLQEIGRIRLLRADEEIELARKITELLQMERVRERLSEQLERDPHDSEWAEAVQLPLPTFRYRLHLNRRAKEKMVQSNLRLVVSIAKKYMNRGLSFQDLIQEGSLGLIRATEKFDHEKGYKFSTYATWWICQAITRAIAEQSRTIRIPVDLYETISRIKKTTKLLSQEIGRNPNKEEIATRMEMTVEKLRFIAKFAQLPISLETPFYIEKDSWFDEGDTQEYLYLGDLIEADEETPEDQVSKNLLREDLEKALDSLSPRERDVLRLRYGLDDGRMKTSEEIGQIFNVTPYRISQIEVKALRKLRHPNRNSTLKENIRAYQPHELRENKYEEQSEANHKDAERIEKDSFNTQNAVVYFNRGVERYKIGCFQGAVKDFTQAIRLNLNYADAYNRRSSAYAALGNYHKATEDLQRATNLYLI